MEPDNLTRVSEFLLLGLSEEPELQPCIFELFLSMYLITVLGNVLIILAVSSDSHLHTDLHTPMYFFLCNLSLVDICFTSTTIPKMLVNIQTQSKVITYEGCNTQLYFFLFFGAFNDFLLTLMAYDHFVAICHPLHYMVIMNPRLCGLLVFVSWIYKPRSVPQLCCYPQFTVKCSSLSDVHCGDTHAEPLHPKNRKKYSCVLQPS
ncbi:Olfactory receptor 7A17 [Pteropus alecto]|uniref:Olfactory receptor 7A17 n=1 Tax=Pteropus alecto TaxID=9402 RepID=L5KC93_PTEAL|nr:Olfactory receptor 7A17 [Pteropus alecto]